MGQKEDIVNLLNLYDAMTQSALAEIIYGDKQHAPNIYSALMALVKQGAVIRNGGNPSYYSLTDKELETPEKINSSNKKTYKMMLYQMRPLKMWRP